MKVEKPQNGPKQKEYSEDDADADESMTLEGEDGEYSEDVDDCGF